LTTRKFEASDVNVQIERVNLCGLRLKVGRYHIKIWKISADDLAKALRRVDSAERQMILTDHDGVPISPELAIFWTAENHRLGNLYLVQQQAPTDPRCFDWVWYREIPQATSVKEVDAGDVAVEDIGEEKKTKE